MLETEKLQMNEAAVYLKISYRTMLFLKINRTIPYSQPAGRGGKVYFDKKDLDDYLDKNRVEKKDEENNIL